jgi:small subunit ribosomal protein S6
VREYETTLIIQPETSDEAVLEFCGRLDGIVEKGGGIRLMYDDQGRRRLGYEIRNFQKGRYVMLHFLDVGDVIPTLERALRLEDSVLRFLTVQVTDEVTDIEARKVQAAEEVRIRAQKAAERAAREAEEAAERAEREAEEAAAAEAAGEAAVAAAAAAEAAGEAEADLGADEELDSADDEAASEAEADLGADEELGSADDEAASEAEADLGADEELGSADDEAASEAEADRAEKEA